MATTSTDMQDEERRPLLSRTSTAYEGEAATAAVQDGPQISVIRAIILCLSIFVLLFVLTSNVSAITTIQSSIATELNASSEVSWFSSAYLIAVTSITPVSGKLCQIFTPRSFLLVSMVISAIGLVIVSQARSLAVFLVGRTVCGIGGAAVTPVAFILVTKFATTNKRAIFFGLLNTGYTTGLACGAIIAGALEPVLGWRAVFWLPIPLTLLAAVTAFFAIGEDKTAINENDTVKLSQKLARIDYFGMLTLVIALVMVLYTLSAPKIEVVAVILSLAMIALFVFVELRWAAEPVVPPAVLKSRANILSGFATVGVMSARWGILFYVPVYGIAVRGWTQSAAGALLIPTNAGFATGGLVAGWLHIRRPGSFYVPTLVSFALFALIHFGVSQLVTATSPIGVFIGALFLNGFVVGALLNYSLAHLLHLTHPSEHVIVIPFNATFRSFSGSFGSAITGGYFLRTLYQNLDLGFKDAGIKNRGELIKSLLGSPRLVQQLEGAKKEIALWAYTGALKSTFLGGVVLALCMLGVQACAGWTAPMEDDDPKAARDRDEDVARVASHEPMGA